MCGRCEELQERIAWLESELGIAAKRETMLALHRTLNIRPAAATVLARLYHAAGKHVTTWELMDATALPGRDDDRSPNIVSVSVWSLRRALGRDAIETAYGHGYRLSDGAIAQIAEILSQKTRAA